MDRNLFDLAGATGVPELIDMVQGLDALEGTLDNLEVSGYVEGDVDLNYGTGAPPQPRKVRFPLKGQRATSDLRGEVAKLRQYVMRGFNALKTKGLKGAVQALSRNGTRCFIPYTAAAVAAAASSAGTAVTPQGSMRVSAIAFFSNTPGLWTGVTIAGQPVLDGSQSLVINPNVVYVQQLNEPIDLASSTQIAGIFANRGPATGDACFILIPEGSMFQGVRY